MHAEFLITQDQMTLHENVRRLMLKLEKRDAERDDEFLTDLANEQAAEEAGTIDDAGWDDDGPPPMCDP